MERVILVGADDVYRGGTLVLQAAHEMSSAAAIIESALSQHQRFMQQWLYDFQAIKEEKKDA